MGMSMALVGGASALAGMFGGGKASDVQLPPQWNMPNRDAAAGGAFSGIQGMQPWTDLGMQTMPFAQNIFEQQFYNPYASMYQSGAGGASGLGMNAALNQYGAGGQLMGFGGQAINTGFDPRSALYNRSLQQTQEQLRAGLEARGVNMTPYGAGVEGQTLGNFNIDWQNQQLGRQLQALQGGGQAIGMGSSMQAGAPGQFLQAAGMPYSVFGQIGQGQNQALSQLLGLAGQGQGLGQQQIQDYLNYIQAGTQQQSANNQTAQLALAQQQQQFRQNQQYGQALGGSMYGMGQTPWGKQWGMGGSGWGDAFSGWGGGAATPLAGAW